MKLPQMVTSDALEGKAAEPAEQLPAVSPWSKILVAFAGPLMNVLFGIVIACLSLGSRDSRPSQPAHHRLRGPRVAGGQARHSAW